MKTKANYFNQFLLIFFCMTFGGFLGAFAPVLFYDVRILLEIFGAMIISNTLLLVLLNVLNLLIVILLKPHIVFHEKEFIYKYKEYKYSEISKIGFDFGDMSRTSGKPFMLYLYRDGQDGIVIKNPSIITIIKFKKLFKDKEIELFGTDLLKIIFIISFVMTFIFSTILICFNL